MGRPHLMPFCLAASIACGEAHSQSAAPSDPKEVETINVWGHRRDGVGVATSASEGEVAFAKFADRPLIRPGELVEVIPGMAATQHSGSGKANQYFLRGFNIDHGTDFSASLDGAPLNMRTNAHGQGYLDLNFVTPELIQTIGYRKGPYSAETGDFSVAGSTNFEGLAQLSAPIASVTVGSHAYGRFLGAHDLGAGYVALDVTTSRGPWVRPEDLRKATLIVSQTLGDWRLTGLAYGAKWNSTDQVPDRAIASGLISRLGAIDPTDGGQTQRVLLSAKGDIADDVTVTASLQAYALRLRSNFTYYLDDPINGDQFEQSEHRWIAAGGVKKSWRGSGPWSFRAGAEGRYDHIGQVGLYHTRAGLRLETLRQDRVNEGSVGVWGEVNWAEGPLRASLGLRGDAISVDVASNRAVNSGSRSDALVSPKLTLAWRLTDQVELYADAGRGYHSNDARGATAHMASDGSMLTPVDLLVPAVGGEIGARYERSGLQASLTVWTLNLNSELVYSGDSGDTESSNKSRRLGAEALINWRLLPSLDLDLTAATTRARYVNAPGADRIPNALDYVITAGATWQIDDLNTAELTVRRLGPAALIEDNSARSRPSTAANLLLRHRWDRFEGTLEILNLFDSHDDDIAYFYTSRLKGEPAGGIDDYHRHPMEPRTFRLGVRAKL